MSFGARELIWLLIAALAVYVLLQLLRLRSAARGRKQVKAEVKAAMAGADVVSSKPLTAGAGDAGAAAGPVPAAANEAVPALARDEVRDRAERIALELEVQQLRRDISQLRDELDEQRREGERIAIEVGLLRDTVAGVAATQRVSPQYNEAVMLARRGLSAEAVAERCGISVAEAALVRSMIQREDQQGENT